MTSTTDVLLVLFSVVLLFTFFQYLLRYVITYRLTNRSVLITLFWVVPIFRIPYRCIKEIRVATGWPESLRDIIFWNFCNRLYSQSGCVVIHRKWGLTAAISPDNPEVFVGEVRRRVYQQTGEWPLAL